MTPKRGQMNTPEKKMKTAAGREEDNLVGKCLKGLSNHLTGPTTSQKIFSLEKMEAKYLILYFYPKDHTSACTLEGQEFAAKYKEFKKVGAEIIGVSRDSLSSHEKFKAKILAPFELLSDPEEKLCSRFGVIKQKNMYGRKVLGIERSTFIIDNEGVVRAQWRGLKVAGHVDEVLKALKALAKTKA